MSPDSLSPTNNLESDQYVIKWLTGLAKKTKDGYLKEIPEFLTFVGMSPTEIIGSRMRSTASFDVTERTLWENKWREYKEYLEAKGTLSDATVHGRLRTVASFFSRNDLPLNLHKGDWKSTQKQSVKEKALKLNQEELKRMYGHASLRDKCLLLCLGQSGFSEIDVSELKIEEIKGLYELPVNEHYVIEKPREKTGEIQATCLSFEFLHDLRDYLTERGNPTTGYIFISQTKVSTSPIETRRINEAMKSLYAKTFGEKKAKEFKTKMLRSFYNSALLRAKIQPQEIKDLLMGHQRLGARKHYAYDDETIREAYIQAFEHLSINGIQSREDLAKIKADLHAIIGKQQVQIETQNNRMEELQKTVDEMPHLIKEELKRMFPEMLRTLTTKDLQKMADKERARERKQ